MTTEYGINTRFTRENVTTNCPICRHLNTYNRKSDLRATRRIDFKRVTCQNPKCASSFAINGDIVSPEVELLLLEAYSDYHQKEYSRSVTTVITAYDVLAKIAIRQLISGHIAPDNPDPDWEGINAINEELDEKTHGWSARQSRNAAANLLARRPANTGTGARQLIAALPRLAAEPPDEDVLQELDPKIAEAIRVVLHSTARTIRNEVAHDGYLPTREEASQALEEAREIIYMLSEKLNLRDAEPYRL